MNQSEDCLDKTERFNNFLDEQDKMHRLSKEDIERRHQQEYAKIKAKIYSNQPSVFDIVLCDTQNNDLNWSLGSHSDIWSAKHKFAYYDLKLDDGIFFHYLSVNMKNGSFFRKRISCFQWKKLRKAILNNKEVNELEASIMMQGKD